jgi:prepilin-type N-terminal cleavage/methylation domain-containing protein
MSRNNNRRAFTLIEIMIVVLIIGILLAIAIPNFVRARESSRQKACISNLKQIQSAKEQWAMDNRKGQGDTPPTIAVLSQAGEYIKDEPKCPASGTYTEGATVDADPDCSYGTAPFEHNINALNL